MNETTCRCCAAFVHEDENYHSVFGFCHRHPPMPCDDWKWREDHLVLVANWPRVNELDSCLEFVSLDIGLDETSKTPEEEHDGYSPK